MKIEGFSLHRFQTTLLNGQKRDGLYLELQTEDKKAFGECSPLPHFSKETFEEAASQLKEIESFVLEHDWSADTCLLDIKNLKLIPSVAFALESALLSLLFPLTAFSVQNAALLMGTFNEIAEKAYLLQNEGYTIAKLKVAQLSFDEAATLIHKLKDTFRLRIDVNRAWSTPESLSFFSKFSQDSFDYVEEPFQNPHDLHLFPLPLAVDESYPNDLELEDLEKIPSLKALIYKPTLQGGLCAIPPLYEWTRKRGVSLVLSSCFESDIGLGQIASLARRLSLTAPIGIGTYHYLTEHRSHHPLKFTAGNVQIPGELFPRLS